MIFDSPIGIGEVVVLNILADCKRAETKKRPHDELGKVKAIQIDSNGDFNYLVDYRNSMSGIDYQKWYSIKELEGDEDFNQELGCYPEEEE